MRSCIPVLYLTGLLLSGATSHLAARAASPLPAAAASATLPAARPAALSAAGAQIAAPPAATAQAPAATADPDALYAARTDLAKARQAADVWQARLQQDPHDFESAWKAARALYWLGGHGPEAGRTRDLEAGIAAAQTASTLEPMRPEGYFWAAANMGALAESAGMRAGLRYRKPIKEALETALKLDPAFQQGSADRALGRWYFKVPGLFGGSSEKSEAHLRKSLTYDPNSTASHYFLAETLLDMGRKADARAELQKTLDAPLNPDWTPEDREFKQQAQTLLAKIGKN